ncbi:MAG: serine/threonine protein kinase [Firmicutes bacterium]|nr:serine/threonine protein kinase [Bacillota bacterium]
MRPEISEYLEYKYEKISTICDNNDKTILLLRDKQTGEYCRYKRINRYIDVFEKTKNIKSEYLPEIYYLHYDKNETVVIEEEIRGVTLQAQLDSVKTFNDKDSEKIFLGLCSALSVLHKNGIVHRDLKPSNIMLSNGKIKLVDFDASREVKQGTLNDTVLLGTKGFAPPEQYGFSQTDSRSDIYALGVTMQLISGKKSKYRKIIKKCLSFAPKDRYKTANSVKRAIYLRKYRPLLITATAAVCIFAMAYNTYYNDPVFRDDLILLFRDGGFITLTEEQENRILARQSYDKKEIKTLWCGKYISENDSEIEISYNNALSFTAVTYDNGLKTNLLGGKLTLENKQTAIYTTDTSKGTYKITLFIYDNGIFVSENDIPCPFGRQSISGYYKKIE